jgi:O-antigen ligase
MPRNLAQLLLVGVILLAGLVSLPQEISAGSVTGLGIASVLVSGLAWLLWSAHPKLSHRHIALLLPLILFGVYAVGSLLWSPPGMQAMQLLCILLGFVGLVLLTTCEVEEDPSIVPTLYSALDFATWSATALYAFSIVRDGLGADSIILARPYALFVLLGMARQLALWQSGDRRGLVGAAVILAVLAASISRTALAAGALMVPLAGVIRGGRKGYLVAIGSAAVAISFVAAVVMLSPTIHKRFFGFDASMRVGGVAINASGRTEMWGILWESAQHTPILGRGVGSSSELIGHRFSQPGVGHPHNDYLRFFHDFGVVGLVLWFAFHPACGVTLWKRFRSASKSKSGDHIHHLVPLLGLFGLAVGMTTDNPVAYGFVMWPLAIMIGCSLGNAEEVSVAEPEVRRASVRASRWLLLSSHRPVWRRGARATTLAATTRAAATPKHHPRKVSKSS